MAAAPPITPARSSQSQPRHARLIFIVLIGLLALAFALLYHTHNEPLENNMPQYALIGHEMRGGRVLYADIFDQKPPAIYLTYALAEMAFGYGRQTIFLLQLIAVGGTLLGIYTAASALLPDRRYGLWATAAYALACCDLGMQANQPNAEVFISACLTWGFAILARANTKVLSFGQALMAGLLFTLATLYKPTVVLVPLLLMPVYVLLPPGGPANRRAAFRAAFLILGLIAVAWMSLCLYFALHGRFAAFFYAVITYNQAYSGSLTGNLLKGLHRYRWANGGLVPLQFVPEVLLLIGLVIGLRTPARAQWLLLAAFACAAYIAVILPGVELIYYYVVLLPPLLIGVSWLLAALAPLKTPHTTIVAVLIGVAFLALVGYREGNNLRLSAVEWSLRKYDGPQFVNAEIVAQHINILLLPNEIFYDASTNPELYFLSKRPMQCGVFYSEATVKGPKQEEFADRVITYLDRHPPELISFRAGEPYQNARIYAWIRKRYEPLPRDQQLAPFILLMRRGGILSQRLKLGHVSPIRNVQTAGSRQ